MLHSIFYSVDHMPIEVVQPEVILTEEIMKNDVDRDTPGDATTDDDTVENTDSTNLPLLIKQYCCEECRKSFSTNKTLRRHIRRIHNRAPEPISNRSTMLQKKSSDSKVYCADCEVWFSANKNLLRHIRTSSTHKQRVGQKKSEMAAPLPNVENDTAQLATVENVTENIKVERELSSVQSIEELPIADTNVVMKKCNIQELKSECSIENIKIETDENIPYLDTNSLNCDLQDSLNPSIQSEGIIDTSNIENISLSVPVVKKYPCEKCGQQFTKKSNVYRHMRRIHNINVEIQKPKETLILPFVEEETSQKRYACEKCDQTYTKKCNLLRHMRNIHKLNTASQVTISNGIEHNVSLETSKIQLKFASDTSASDLESFLMSDKNLRLSEYPFLKNMLPASYDYTLKFYSDLIEKDISFKCFVATIQFHCTTVGESKYWVSLFEKANKLSFKCLNAHSFENDGSKLLYRCDVEGCPASLSISVFGANVMRKSLLRVTIRIVHKHNHKWDPPRLDLSQLVEAVIEDQDLIEQAEDAPSADQFKLPPQTAYYTSTSTEQGGQQPVMTLYFNKDGNSYVTQNLSVLTNGASESLSGLVLLDGTKLGKRKSDDGTEYDVIGQFKRVCNDMIVMIQQEPQYFAEAVQKFEASFDQMCNSKSDLLNALHEFGKNREECNDVPMAIESETFDDACNS